MCYSRKLRNYISVNPSKALRNCKVKVTLLLPGRIWLRWRARGELPHCFQQWRHFVDALGCFQEAICVIRWIDTKMNRRLVSRLKRINFISGPHFFFISDSEIVSGDNFFDALDNGVVVCRLARVIQEKARTAIDAGKAKGVSNRAVERLPLTFV